MTRAEVAEAVKELITAARQSTNAARACDAQEALFRHEYDGLIKTMQNSERDRERALDLYHYVVEIPRQARQLRSEADLFLRVADHLQKELD